MGGSRSLSHEISTASPLVRGEASRSQRADVIAASMLSPHPARALPRLLLGGLLLLVGCTSVPAAPTEVGEQVAPVVFDHDNRLDPSAYADQDWAAQAMGFTVALVKKGAIELRDGRA